MDISLYLSVDTLHIVIALYASCSVGIILYYVETESITMCTVIHV